MEEYVVRRPDGRYVGKPGGSGWLRPEDARIFWGQNDAERAVAALGEGHVAYRRTEAPQPETTLVTDGKGGFASSVRGGLARRGEAVVFGALCAADRFTDPEVERIQAAHPEARPVTGEEAVALERARQEKEGIEEQWGKAHGF